MTTNLVSEPLAHSIRAYSFKLCLKVYTQNLTDVQTLLSSFNYNLELKEINQIINEATNILNNGGHGYLIPLLDEACFNVFG